MTDAATGVRRLAYAGALTALAVGICYLEQIPWFELQSVVVFAAGYLLGARAGALVGGVAMGIYSLANPYGMAHPAVLAAQVLGRAFVGATGGWAAALGLPRAPVARGLVLVLWAAAGATCFDQLTNFASGVAYGQIGPSMVMGLPWAFAHLLSNAAVYALVGAPLTAALDTRRAGLAVCVAVILVFTCGAPAQAQDTTSVFGTTDTLRILPDTSRVLAPPLPPLETKRGLSRWGFEMNAQERLRRAPQGDDDAWSAVGGSPRFYEDRGVTELLAFGAFPSGMAGGTGEGTSVLTRSTVWQESGAPPWGAREATGWSAVPFAAVDTTTQKSGTAPAGYPGWGARGSWGSAAEPRRGRSAFSAAWIGIGRETRTEQGFFLDAGKRIRGADVDFVWSAWTRSANPLAELGEEGEHALALGATVRAGSVRARLLHESHRVAVEDFAGFEFESRGDTRSAVVVTWEGAGGFAGFQGERLQERLESTGPVLERLLQKGTESSGGLWAGLTRGAWRLGARAGWSRERLRRALGIAAYDPPILEPWRVGLFVQGEMAGGRLDAGVDAEHLPGETRILPRASWLRSAGERWTIDARAGAASAPQLVETGALDPLGVPDRVTAHGWVGQLGLRYGDPERELAMGDTTSVRASPGSPPQTALSGRVALVGWTLQDVPFPDYGIFARDIVTGGTVISDVNGGAILAMGEWWPAHWATVGASGYAAARETPANASAAAPEYRWIGWAGPHVTLFKGSLDLLLLGELDAIGPRLAIDEDLPSIGRPGARLVLGFGDAWIIIRGIDLDDKHHPLPGRRFDGGRLLSSGREIRATLEWRFRN